MLAQTGAVNEITNAVKELSSLGFWGLIILLTLIGSLVVWNVYADKRRYDKANERERERWDRQMENWKSVYDGRAGDYDELKGEIKANTVASNRVSDTFVRYAEHQMASAAEATRNNKQYMITFAEVRASVTELNKSLNTVVAPNISRLADDTRKQLEIVGKQTEQNAGTLNLVKAFAAELSQHEKAAVSRAEQIHVDFERMRKDRQEHLDEMTRTIGVINTKLDAVVESTRQLVESNRRLDEAVMVLIKRSTDEVAKVEVPPEGSAAA